MSDKIQRLLDNLIQAANTVRELKTEVEDLRRNQSELVARLKRSHSTIDGIQQQIEEFRKSIRGAPGMVKAPDHEEKMKAISAAIDSVFDGPREGSI